MSTPVPRPDKPRPGNGKYGDEQLHEHGRSTVGEPITDAAREELVSLSDAPTTYVSKQAVVTRTWQLARALARPEEDG